MSQSEIVNITNKMRTGGWPQMLRSVSIEGLRGLTGQTLNLGYPIVAIVGENGTCKSTFLKAAACAYSNPNGYSFYPSAFFKTTPWDTIQSDVKISYSIKRGDPPDASFHWSKPNRKWRKSNKRWPERKVIWLDIARTVPIDAAAGYAKIAKLSASEVNTASVTGDYLVRLSNIMGRTYTAGRFAGTDADSRKEVGVVDAGYGEVSQFHQGAGEDAMLDLMKIAETIPNNALIIIDEVEASLHPRAQRRIVDFLLWICRVRQAQIILSTHSPFILEELPSEARALLLRTTAGINNRVRCIAQLLLQ